MSDKKIMLKISNQLATQYPAATNLLRTGSRKKTEMILTVLESLCSQHGLSGESSEHVNLIIGLARYGSSVAALPPPDKTEKAMINADRKKTEPVKEKKKPTTAPSMETVIQKPADLSTPPDPEPVPEAEDMQPSDFSIDGMPDGLLDSMGIDLM